MIPYLGALDPFPPVELAREDMGGLLAVGGGLPPDRLLMAYRQGIFPWGTVDGLPLWYSPDPRMVLFPEEFRLTRSLRKTLRAGNLKSALTATSRAPWTPARLPSPRPGRHLDYGRDESGLCSTA
jgi:leucyl/phenylalanyl-tRNA--protein transferase